MLDNYQPPRLRRIVKGCSLRLVLTVPLFLGGLFVLWWLGSTYLPLLFPPQPEGVGQNVRGEEDEFFDAFDGRGPAGAGTVEGLFEALGEAAKAGDQDRVGAAFDAEGMFQEAERCGALGRLNAGQRERLLARFRAGLPGGMAGQPILAEWSGHRIKNVRALPGGEEVVVLVKHWTHRAPPVHVRWRVRQRAGRWRIVDFEDLGSGISFAALLGTLVGAVADGDPPPWFWSAFRMGEVGRALVANDLRQADKVLREMEQAEFPALLEGWRRTLLGSLRLRQGRPREALDHFARAEACRAGMPGLDLLRGKAHNLLGNHEAALTHLRRYLELVEGDADGYLEAGNALSRLGRAEEAAAAYRKGLDEEPDRVGNLVGLGLALPAGRKAEVAERFARLSDPRGEFEGLAQAFLKEADAEAVEVLVRAFRRLVPEDPGADYFTARLKVLRQSYQESAEILRRALPRVKDGAKRYDYLTGYLNALREAVGLRRAYRLSPDPSFALAYLTDGLPVAEKSKLRKLLKEHRKRQPGDPWLHYYRGRLYLLGRQYDKAERAFAAGMADKRLGEDVREQYRNGGVDALFRAGNGLAAYETLGPSKATFDQLAWLFVQQKDADGLRALTAMHRRVEPSDPDLLKWEVEVIWFRQDYAQVVRMLTQHHHREVFSQRFGALQLRDRLVRSLVRIGRLDEALMVVAAPPREEHLNLLEAVIRAAAGDVARTAEALKKCVEVGLGPEDFYHDWDLGPALRTDRFRALRARYPEPKDQGADTMIVW
jgi:tetratricopeptide (TPR) repeat protein